MSRISYSTAGFRDRDVEAALDAVVEAGFARAEIQGQEPHLAEVPQGRELIEFRGRLEARGLGAGTVHAPATTNILGAPEEDWRREKVEVLASYIRFTAAIGAVGTVVHPVPNPIFVADAEAPEIPGRIEAAVHRSLDDLVPVAAAAGVRILLENLPYDCSYPFLSMPELRPLVDAYPPEALGLMIDTGHAWTAHNDPADEIRAAGPRLWGTHLQDVDREDPQDNHWAPTHGDLDWDRIREALAQVDYGGHWTFEVLFGRHGETPGELARITRQVAREWGL